MNYLDAARDLRDIVSECERRFLAIPDKEAGRSSGQGQWSRKQILGHLIDSATNNHQRFIRMQLAEVLKFPGYEQNEWVRLNHYAARPWKDLVVLWAAYNRHLAEVIEHIAPETLTHVWDKTGDQGGDTRYDLEFVATDYVAHLRHHVEQIERG
jgi:hypothetical protein